MSHPPPRLLITGASGYLGSHLLLAATNWETWGTCFTRPLPHTWPNSIRLDLRDSAAVREALDRVRPRAIIHAALSNADPGMVAAIPDVARTLAEAAGEGGIRLVHVSTDLIWDGTRPPYLDDSPPSPGLEYGEAKARAEALVAAICPAAAIVRPSLIWGLDPLDRQTRWLVDDAVAGKRVRLFADEIRCPVWVRDLSEALLELARAEIPGALNVGGPQPLSRWEFGQRLLSALGLSPMPNVVRSTIAESGLRRAADLTMISARANRELKSPLRSVDEALTGMGGT